MKRSGIRKNNRGDSLILVIGCIALLSIIGVILLAKTMDNRSMKVAEEQGQASFFGAESGSAEMVTAIETVALKVVEDAFADMLIEFSLASNQDDRNARFNEFFTKKVKKDLEDVTFAQQLAGALNVNVADITDLSVSCGDVVIEGSMVDGYTSTVRVKEAVFAYTAAGSETTIKTDICIKAKIPDVEHGFNTGISCDFADFAIITDGSATVTSNEPFTTKGNMYVGADFVTTGNSVISRVSEARKLLVKGELKVDNNAQVWVNNGTKTFLNGEGLWVGGISVHTGLLDTENVNVYVTDDLAVEGKLPEGSTLQTKVEMSGDDSEYVGFSGNTSATVNHEGSSAITINEISNLTLDLSGLNKVYINGNSYICEDNSKWGTWDTDAIATADGIMQGETVAFKDMQAMYLYPGSCLPQGHNPIIGENVTVGSASMDYSFVGPGGTETMDLSLYVDNTNPYVTRTAVLDGGATKATYVYLNFKNAAAAAQYVQDYLATSKGISIKSQIVNMGNSTVKLPSQTITMGNAFTYIGGTLTMLPGATSAQLPALSTSGLLAKQRYRGLFSTLRAEAGVHVASDYKLAKNGIVDANAVETILAGGEEKHVSVTDPTTSATYDFYVHRGDFTIGDDVESQKFLNFDGILLVYGNLTISRTNTDIEGLVLATGNVSVPRGATLTSNATIVETLLANDEVAKFFRVYGDTTGNGYLSTESVNISFENWHKN